MGLCLTPSHAAVMNFQLSGASPSSPSTSRYTQAHRERDARFHSQPSRRLSASSDVNPYRHPHLQTHAQHPFEPSQQHAASFAPLTYGHPAMASQGGFAPSQPRRDDRQQQHEHHYRSRSPPQHHPRHSTSPGPQPDRSRRNSSQAVTTASAAGSGKKRGTGAWTEAEDARLFELVRSFGTKNWVSVERAMEGRDKKQCRERWCNHVNPHINDAPFSEAESIFIIDCYVRHGRQWARMSRCPELQNRPDNAIKNHFNTNLRDHYAELCRQFNIPRRQPNDLQELDVDLYERIKGKITSPPASSMRGSKTSRFVASTAARSDLGFIVPSTSPSKYGAGPAPSVHMVTSPHSSSSSSLDPSAFPDDAMYAGAQSHASPYEGRHLYPSAAAYQRQTAPSSAAERPGWVQSRSMDGSSGDPHSPVEGFSMPQERGPIAPRSFAPRSFSASAGVGHGRGGAEHGWDGPVDERRREQDFHHQQRLHNHPAVPRGPAEGKTFVASPPYVKEASSHTRNLHGNGLHPLPPPPPPPPQGRFHQLHLPPLPLPSLQGLPTSQPTTPVEDVLPHTRARSQSELDSEHKSLLWSNVSNLHADRRGLVRASNGEPRHAGPSTGSARFAPYARPMTHSPSSYEGERPWHGNRSPPSAGNGGNHGERWAHARPAGLPGMHTHSVSPPSYHHEPRRSHQFSDEARRTDF